MAGSEQLQANFDDNSYNQAEWDIYETGTTIEAKNQGITINLAVATAGDNYAGFFSEDTYSMVNSYCYLKAISVPNPSYNGAMYLKAYIDDQNDYLEIYYEAGVLYYQYYSGGVGTVVSSENYSSNLHVFWRLREQDGTFYWETSPNGYEWDTRASTDTPMDVSDLTLEFGGGTYQSEASPGICEMDSFNTTVNLDLARSNVRNIFSNLLVSWKKDSTLGATTFTIGVSLIGGDDFIGINPGAIGSAGNYRYFDESQYLLSLEWERGLNIPIGGLSKGFAEAELDNTSGRFLPEYMGGNSELYTSILPRRPFILSSGFYVNGVGLDLPQFSGTLTKQPAINVRDKSVYLQGADYTDFFDNRYLDQEVMFTSQRTDEVIESLFVNSLGMSTAQFELDTGINIIPFGLFEKGTKFSSIMNELVQAEYGHLYQDENGIYRFENRQHWDSSPYNSVQYILPTAQVINAEAPNDDHIINVVEIRGQGRVKRPETLVFKSSSGISIKELPVGETVSFFVEFENPVLSTTAPSNTTDSPSYFKVNTSDDGTGTDLTSSVTLDRYDEFAKSAKLEITNNSGSFGYLVELNITGRPAEYANPIYYRDKDSSSVTAYEERPYLIENPYIQNETWAQSLASLILNDFGEPEKLQKLTIRAIPQLKLGDLISWQGRYWRIFDIKNKIDPSYGYVQELTMLQRNIVSYFRIGISLIGSDDQIAP